MIRVQVYLEPDDDEWLEQRSNMDGTTKSALIREGIRALRAQDVPLDQEPLLELIGMLGPDIEGKTDVAENHDKYIFEAELERWRQST